MDYIIIYLFIYFIYFYFFGWPRHLITLRYKERKTDYSFSKKTKQNKTKKHYENTPIQIYRKFLLQKLKKFQIKNCDIFHISAQNIDCGYSLEPPRRGGANEYPQSMF